MGNHQPSETKMDKGKDYDNLDTNRFIFLTLFIIAFINFKLNDDVSSIDGYTNISVTAGCSKQTSLQLMDEHGLSELSVINESKVFVGVVERDKITSSIVAQLMSSVN